MNRAVLASAAAALIAAASAIVIRAAAEEGRSPIYFQDPDGKPSYSLTPIGLTVVRSAIDP